MKKLFQSLKEHLDENREAVLVTVVGSSGSTPRGAGAHMLVDDSGRSCGTIGGGAIEYRALEIAAQVLKEKGCSQEHFLLRTNKVEDLGMVCGGEVSVWFRYLDPQNSALRESVELAVSAFHDGDPCWLIQTSGREPRLAVYSNGKTAGDAVPKKVISALHRKPVMIGDQNKNFFAEPMLRSGRVYIFGGGHVAQALVPALTAVDFRCVVVEDRREFCSPELFPGVEETVLMTREEWGGLHITNDDYICIMTRGHKNDIDCEAFALATAARYIGVIGSRKKIAYVNSQLKERGFTDEDLARITTPIGLPILAETPAEIAVSITAQLIMERAEK